AGAVATLEDHADLGAGGLDPLLHGDELGLELAQLRLVLLAFQLHLGRLGVLVLRAHVLATSQHRCECRIVPRCGGLLSGPSGSPKWRRCGSGTMPPVAANGAAFFDLDRT